MLRSMTGFGSAQQQIGGVEYAVEVRSVNNCYYKGVAKLPDALAGLEADIDSLLRQSLSRGTVTLSLRMKLLDAHAACSVNAAALQSYLDQLRPLEIEANPMLRIDLGSLLQLPGVCEPAPIDDVIERTRDGLFALIRKALADLVEMRKIEGSALRDDLLAHCAVIEANLEAVRGRAPLVVQEYHKRLTERVQQLVNAAKIEIDAEQLAREVAIFADRCDIAEETARLSGHIEQFREAIGSPEPAGRKLDFIAQEMLREANTIASKSGDVAIARAVVDIKTAVDRIKEQVQNAE